MITVSRTKPRWLLKLLGFFFTKYSLTSDSPSGKVIVRFLIVNNRVIPYDAIILGLDILEKPKLDSKDDFRPVVMVMSKAGES